MRLARVIAKLEPGGAQLTVLRLTKALGRLGVESRVLAGEATPEGLAIFAREGIDVEVWGGGKDVQYECNHGFAAWLEPRIAASDVVHAHMFGAWWAVAKVIPASLPLVASEHNSVRWPAAHEPEARAALVRVNRFFAHGPDAREFVSDRGLPRDRSQPGVSVIDSRVPAPDPSLPRGRIVYAGRLHPEKGPDVLLRALAMITPPPPTYMLGIGPMADELHALRAECGLEGVVRFCGWQEEASRWVRGASACVVPSRHEAWSQSAVQAMALGTPVIGTDVEGLPLTLANGRGILVAAEDPPRLAAAIEGVLARRRLPDLAAARRYAVEFMPRPVADRYARVYRDLVDHRSATRTGRFAHAVPGVEPAIAPG